MVCRYNVKLGSSLILWGKKGGSDAKKNIKFAQPVSVFVKKSAFFLNVGRIGQKVTF